MGIPRFYRWLRNRYPQIRLDLSDQNKYIPLIDHLYIDFNALIYRCLRESGCFLKNKTSPLTIEEIYNRVIEYMMSIINRVDPQKLIFIGVDGVAPRAKINQSRDRRFKATKDINEFAKILRKLNIQDKQNFKENSISPGTQFLLDLCQVLKQRINQLKENQWKNLTILFSDCSNPGQGQHKIMEFIRNSKKSDIFHPETTRCIYSPDADVILLSLSLEVQNICIIRQDSLKSNFGYAANSHVRYLQKAQFEIVYINILREYLECEFSSVLSTIEKCSLQSIINDFILLMAFIGNDFLPVEFCFTLKESHMQNLFFSYKQYLLQNKIFINENGYINWKNISKLLLIAKQFQAQMLKEKINNKRSRNRPSLIEQEEEKQKEEEDDDEVQMFEIVDNEIIKGKEHYYESRFGIKNTNDPKFETIIYKYIEGLQFYNRYYFEGLPSWNWFYPYHYTPLLTDVYNYIQNKDIKIEFKKTEPFDPLLALMFMLPISSFHLLPTPISQAIKNQKCQLRTPTDYYPSQFKQDKYESISYNKRALIPFLEEDMVISVYKSIPSEKYSAKQKERNQNNHSLLCYFKDKIVHLDIRKSNQKLPEELTTIFPKIKKASSKKRFPTLQIYGQVKLDERLKLACKRKYKYEGNHEMVFYNNFLGFIEDADKCSEQLKYRFQNVYEKSGMKGQCTNYYFVKQATLVREVGRFNYVKTKRQAIVPDFALFKVPKYEYLPEIQMKKEQDMYEIGQQVVIISQKFFGYQAIIESKDNNGLTLQLTKQSYSLASKPEENSQQFYTLEYVADLFGLSPQLILIILEEITLLPKSSKNNSEIFPFSVNLGLNLINTKDNKIVPQYVRCQMEYENTKKNFQIFKKLEISERLIPILKQYLHEMSWLVDYVDNKLSQNDFSFKKGIPVKEIFSHKKTGEKDKNQPQYNIKLFEEFIKLYKLKIQGIFYSIYSKVTVENCEIVKSETVHKKITLPYHQVISKRLGKLAPPPIKHQPEFHYIGDRVIILKTLQVGFVVGVDDNYIILQTPNSKQLKKCLFSSVFNQRWISSLMKNVGECWDLNISYYSPQYYTKVSEKQ